MAAKFTQEPFRLRETDIVADTGPHSNNSIAEIYGMDGPDRSKEGPETDANRRLFLHSQALYRLAEQVADGNGATTCVCQEAKRLVDAIDGVRPKLEWKASGLGRWEARGANGYVDWRIRVDMKDGTFSVTRDEGGAVTKSGFPSLAEAKAYCQAEEGKA